MDPTNQKYNTFSDTLHKRRADPENKWNEDDKKTLGMWYETMRTDPYFGYLSYYNMLSFRFLLHLLCSISCILCGKNDNFGVHDQYCDTCVREMGYNCIGGAKCQLKGMNRFCPHYNMAVIHFEKIKYWDYYNNNLRPEYLLPSGGHRQDIIWFDCPICLHKDYSKLRNIFRLKPCHYCATKNYKLCGKEECKHCLSKSFASHEKSQYWLKNRNEDITPIKVPLYSDTKYWFNCGKCGHDFRIGIYHIVYYNQWCPYCTSQKLCGTSDCLPCKEKCIAGSWKMALWSPKNKEDPWKIFIASTKLFIWNCLNCHHEFESSAGHVYTNKMCRYCVNRSSALCSDMSCMVCFSKSFASNTERVKCWDWIANTNINLHPRFLIKGADIKAHFICDVETCKSSFYASLSHVSQGKWCPFCKKKTAALLFKWLKDLCGKDHVGSEFKAEWCRGIISGRYLSFDFLLYGRIIIELDGAQHFEDIKIWNTTAEDEQDNDFYKMQKALDNNFIIIRITQNEIWNNTYDWKTALWNAINEILKNPVTQVIYVEDPKTNNYAPYKEVFPSLIK